MEPESKRADAQLPPANRSAWTWWGFTLVVLGLAGLLFHWVQRVPILNTGEGIASLVALAAGALLLIVGLIRR